MNKRLSLLIIGLAFIGMSLNGAKTENSAPLCFTARKGNITVTFNIYNVTHAIEYSTDGTTWSRYNSGTGVNINADSSVYFRAESDQMVASPFGHSNNSLTYLSNFKFASTNGGTVEASGNIMSLYGPSCPNLPLDTGAFTNMFYGCTLLTIAPELPATSLSVGCYSGLFQGCTSLVTAPALPALSLPPYCYQNMFTGCTSLVDAPELPGTDMEYACYMEMFRGCKSLTTAPALPSKTLINLCYDGMFRYCTSLTEAPELPATVLDDGCYEYMFQGCTSLTKTPELPATVLKSACYEYMFQGCTSLTTLPDLPATKLLPYCYCRMFNGCTSLKIDTAAPGKEWSIQATQVFTGALDLMFCGTAGTMNYTPKANTTYYIASDTTATGVEDAVAEANIAVCPNPVHIGETVYVSADEDLSIVEVYSIDGECVYRSKYPGRIIEINGLNVAGVYIIRMTNINNKVTTRKLIVN